MSKELNHPCKDTCSGWQQGYEAGLKAASPDTHGLEARAGGLEKGAEIARYFRDMPLRNEAYKAACREIETSCLATAIRIRLGKPENPTSDVMQAEKAPTPKWVDKETGKPLKSEPAYNSDGSATKEHRCDGCGTVWNLEAPWREHKCTARAQDDSTRDAKVMLQRLINKVNMVTSAWRHGNEVLDGMLGELHDRQLLAEEFLADSQDESNMEGWQCQHGTWLVPKTAKTLRDRCRFCADAQNAPKPGTSVCVHQVPTDRHCELCFNGADAQQERVRLCDACGQPFKQGETVICGNLEGVLTQTHPMCACKESNK